MRQTWKRSAAMAVLIPGVVVGTAWLITRYAGERGASSARPRSADRWNWPTAAQAAGAAPDDSHRTPHGRRVS